MASCAERYQNAMRSNILGFGNDAPIRPAAKDHAERRHPVSARPDFQNSTVFKDHAERRHTEGRTEDHVDFKAQRAAYASDLRREGRLNPTDENRLKGTRLRGGEAVQNATRSKLGCGGLWRDIPTDTSCATKLSGRFTQSMSQLPRSGVLAESNGGFWAPPRPSRTSQRLLGPEAKARPATAQAAGHPERRHMTQRPSQVLR
mmetsp:Transcript_5261/g.12523  ORF Transcript_5261/g.12523 Transcript_5261/m.12523 type:complete len:203 (+) Transcript_5261:98-706(+)